MMLGPCVFFGCTRLSSITISPRLTFVPDWAFAKCENLAIVNLPDGLTAIGARAFWGCARLTRLIIPARVTSIGDYAFAEWSNL